ncbi:Bug family tripartite tricarboxylate transporter substrate binding protein [Bordetella petrii]|uniref:Bug family tripartite tricarboxylate transporter substrate binding protein n=1 Tax=Bordetella petrii TaxID=94624 RepID=UPI001A9683BB|nr:tripartite tricarboxylate transporter substrate binding protein [Bordetella petrii]MBO1114353.1 tripartite tricarboxylate transporter substrate binding protein [Bordetella petrii]
MNRLARAALSLCFCLGTAAHAAGFPDRPITLVVPVAAGGTMDIAGRVLGQHLKDVLGQTVVVENRPGGSGNIAYTQVARAEPDGYTVLFSYEGFHTGSPALSTNQGWDPVKSFTPIGEVFRGPHVILVPKNAPAQTLGELIAQAKAQPGKLNYASSGVGSIQHLGAEQFKQLTGTDIMHVPYNGAAPAMKDLIAGRVQLFITTPPSAIGHLKAGTIRALAITSKKRHPMLPDVPTTAEAGLPEFTLEAWFSLFGPAGMPDAVRDKLSQALQTVVQSPGFAAQINELGAYASYQPPAELARIVQDGLAHWSAVVKAAGVAAN